MWKKINKAKPVANCDASPRTVVVIANYSLKLLMLYAGLALLLPLTSYGATYGSNFLTGGTASANVEYYPASQAFDNNDATEWLAAGAITLPNWLKYDLGAGNTKYIDKFRLYSYGDSYGRSLKDYEIQGSNDNSNWTTIYAAQSPNGTDSYDQTITLTTTTIAYRYIRFYQTSNWQSGQQQSRLFTWSAYECTDCRSSTSTTSSSTIVRIMSPELDQLLIYILEGLIVIGVAFGTYKILK